MKNIVLAWVLLLAQAPQDRLLGTWTGQVRYGD